MADTCAPSTTMSGDPDALAGAGLASHEPAPEAAIDAVQRLSEPEVGGAVSVSSVEPRGPHERELRRLRFNGGPDDLERERETIEAQLALAGESAVCVALLC